MNRFYSLILFFFCTIFFWGNNTSAQTWPMPGAQWRYCYGNAGAVRDFAYTSDTVINGITYQKIEHISSQYNLGTIYTRYSNDTVYRYVQAQEFPFLVFNAQVGDVYTTFRPNGWALNDSACSSVLPVKVLQIDSVTLGSLPLKRWKLEDTLFNYIYLPNMYDGPFWNIVERIGFLSYFAFVLPIDIGDYCNYPTDMEYNYYLYSYSDSAFSFSQNGDCWGVGIQDHEKEKKLVIYPNPANDILNIALEKVTGLIEISIYDVLGREVEHRNLSNENLAIPVGFLPNGFYFLKYKTADNLNPITVPFIINR